MDGEADGRSGGREEHDARRDPEARREAADRDAPETEPGGAGEGPAPEGDARYPEGEVSALGGGLSAADGDGPGLPEDGPALAGDELRRVGDGFSPGGDALAGEPSEGGASALEAVMHGARALVLADLTARGVAEAEVVSLLEDAVSKRRWWLRQWPDGAAYIPGLLAQDVQDALLETYGRWPLCPTCDDPHALAVEPELGEDPHWVCEARGEAVAPVGSLGV